MKLRNILQNVRLLIALGVILIICGLVILFTMPTIYNSLINSEMVLNPNKRTYELWKKNPFPIALDFYFFNWTNPEDLMNGTVKPQVVEMGPYRFTETKEKVDVVWNDNGTVSFRQLRKWYFDQEYSAGSLEDEVTTLNAVAVVNRRYFYYL